MRIPSISLSATKKSRTIVYYVFIVTTALFTAACTETCMPTKGPNCSTFCVE